MVRDFQLTETAEFWREAPEIERGEVKPEDIGNRSVLLSRPRRTRKKTAASPTRSGCCSGITKRSSRRATARSELDFIFKLGQRLKKLYANEYDQPRNWPIRDLTWDYPTHGPLNEPSAEAVLHEINGYTVADRKPVEGFTSLEGRRLHGMRLLDLLGRLSRRRQS